MFHKLNPFRGIAQAFCTTTYSSGIALYISLPVLFILSIELFFLGLYLNPTILDIVTIILLYLLSLIPNILHWDEI